ncbi:hypothetical protein ACHAWT_001108 [Skeletonema menzelii]
MTAIEANRDLLEKALAVKQNVINIICFFDSNISKDDMRLDFIQTMTTLADKYDRMKSIPRFDVDERNGECVWCPIERNFVEKCVCVDPTYDECEEDDNNEKLVLKRAHSYVSQILSRQDENGQDMPLWRVIILSRKAVLFRIDHCICDGVSAVTLLRDIGVKTSSKEPLVLEDLSPILRYFVRAGELRIRMLPLKLLYWPPNLIRAVKFLVNCLTLPYEVPNPLRPLPEHFGKPIPSNFVGTVYFPTMKVKLFQDMAKKSAGSSTINDVLLLCISNAFGSYFDHLGIQRSDVDGIRLLLPIANPISPSMYNDAEYGLRNGMTPVIVPLKLPSEKYTSIEALKDIQSYMMKVKKSNTPLLMSCANRFLQPLIPLEKVAEKGIEASQRVSCVWSNVPGPFEAVAIALCCNVVSFFSPKSGNMYNIKKIQIVMPHPVSILQVISYDGNLFFNVTLDLRSAKNAEFLRGAFVDAVKNVAAATGVDKEEKWAEELAKYSESKEWGGDGIVYSSA